MFPISTAPGVEGGAVFGARQKSSVGGSGRGGPGALGPGTQAEEMVEKERGFHLRAGMAGPGYTSEAMLARQGPVGSSMALPLPFQARSPQRRGAKVSVSMVRGEGQTGTLVAGVCGSREGLWNP